MNVWHDMNPKRITPEEFIAVIEISKGSINKYELDKESGYLILVQDSSYFDALSGQLWFYSTYLQRGWTPAGCIGICSEACCP